MKWLLKIFNFKIKERHIHKPTKWKKGFGYMHLYALNCNDDINGSPWHRTCEECGKLQSININSNISDLNEIDEKLLNSYISEKKNMFIKTGFRRITRCMTH